MKLIQIPLHCTDKELFEELATLAENDDESSDDEESANALDEKKAEKNKEKQKSIFKRFYYFFGIDSLVNNIQGRAAVVFNYMRGLGLQEYHPIDDSSKYDIYLVMFKMR
jgi:hypothetical protein